MEGDVRHQGLDRQPEPELYVALAQSPPSQLNLVARTVSESTTLDASIRRTVSYLDSDPPATGC